MLGRVPTDQQPPGQLDRLASVLVAGSRVRFGGRRQAGSGHSREPAQGHHALSPGEARLRSFLLSNFPHIEAGPIAHCGPVRGRGDRPYVI